MIARRPMRLGMSLLEVLIALAIFLFSLVGIGQLISYSGQSALEVSQRGHAAQLAQAKLAEVIAGIVPLTSQSEAPFDDDPEGGWTWSLTAEPDSIAGLYLVEIRVSRERSDGTRFETKLSQKVLDPTLRGSTLDAAAAAAAVAASGTTSSTGSSQQQQQQQSQPQTTNSGGAMPSAPAPTPAPAAPAAPTGTKSAAPTGGRGES